MLFGCFAVFAIIEIILYSTSVTISNYWSHTASITNETSMDSFFFNRLLFRTLFLDNLSNFWSHVLYFFFYHFFDPLFFLFFETLFILFFIPFFLEFFLIIHHWSILLRHIISRLTHRRYWVILISHMWMVIHLLVNLLISILILLLIFRVLL